MSARYKIYICLSFLLTNILLFSETKWKFIPPSPARSNAAVSIEGKIYIFGGMISDDNGPLQYFSGLEVYDTLTSSWSSKAPMSIGRHNLRGAVVNGNIYAIGGHYGNSVSVNEMYIPTSNTWIPKAPMTTARSSFGLCVLGDTIYTIGGNASGTITNLVEAYIVLTDTWISLSSLDTARNALSAASLNGKIYSIGGAVPGMPADGKVFEYDPSQDKWVPKASQPTPTFSSDACVIGNKIYVLGGVTAEGYTTKKVQIYDPMADTWSYGDSLLVARDGLACTAVGNSIYVVGGLNHAPIFGFTSIEVLTIPNEPSPIKIPNNANNIELGEAGILWCANYGYKAYKLNLTNSSILDSIRFNITPNPSLDEEGRGIAYDGNYLWYSEWGLDSIFKIDPTNGNVLNRFKSPGSGPQGLAFGDGYLWHTDEYENQIYKIDTASGLIVDSLPVPENSGWFIGIAYSNGNLWLANYTTQNIFKISASDGSKLDSIYFPYGSIGDIACDGNYLYLATDSLYRINTHISECKNILPSKFQLSQNYPNPFNPSTTIEYQLPKRGDVQIRIYNSIGQLVKTLVDDNQQAGNYSVVWNGKNDNGLAVSSGAYYYQITTNGVIEAKKMIMLK